MGGLETAVRVVLEIAPDVVLSREAGKRGRARTAVGVDGAALLPADELRDGRLHLVEERLREKPERGGLLGIQAAVGLDPQVAERQGEEQGEEQDQASEGLHGARSSR